MVRARSLYLRGSWFESRRTDTFLQDCGRQTLLPAVEFGFGILHFLFVLLQFVFL